MHPSPSFLCSHSPTSLKSLLAQTLTSPISPSFLCPHYPSTCLSPWLNGTWTRLSLLKTRCLFHLLHLGNGRWWWVYENYTWRDRENPGKKGKMRGRNLPTCPWLVAGSRPSSSQRNFARNYAGHWGMPQSCNCHAPAGSNQARRAVTVSSPGGWTQRWPLVQSCHCQPKSQESCMAWSTGVLVPVPKWTVRRQRSIGTVIFHSSLGKRLKSPSVPWTVPSFGGLGF